MNKLLRINFSFYIGLFLVSILLILALIGPMLAPHTMSDQFITSYMDGKLVTPPLKPFELMEWPLGTDRWGYDLLSMMLYGLRYTMLIALAVTLLKMIFGTIIGIYTGVWKRTPGWLTAIEQAWGYMPVVLILYFFLSPVTFNSPLKPPVLALYFIVVASVVSIPSIISSVRQKTVELNKSMYIEASRALGAGKHRIIWKHIFPQMKESLLIMFILEIVYVITIMGQLALVNIFIGGTTMTLSPVLYHSVTHELAGLVGQNRSMIYATEKFGLLLPLGVVLVMTIGFSLLANGLKNRFEANYQRTPWIRTGLEPRLAQKRKQYDKKISLGKLLRERLAFLFVSK